MTLVLRAAMIQMTPDNNSGKTWSSTWLEVTEPGAVSVEPRWKACKPKFRMMCQAICADIQSAEGSGKVELENIRRVESGEVEKIASSGNAWEITITPDHVWFEGLYSQGEGGAVTFAQFKIAVETYVRFLSNPAKNAIEIPFLDT